MFVTARNQKDRRRHSSVFSRNVCCDDTNNNQNPLRILVADDHIEGEEASQENDYPVVTSAYVSRRRKSRRERALSSDPTSVHCCTAIVDGLRSLSSDINSAIAPVRQQYENTKTILHPPQSNSQLFHNNHYNDEIKHDNLTKQERWTIHLENNSPQAKELFDSSHCTQKKELLVPAVARTPLQSRSTNIVANAHDFPITDVTVKKSCYHTGQKMPSQSVECTTGQKNPPATRIGTTKKEIARAKMYHRKVSSFSNIGSSRGGIQTNEGTPSTTPASTTVYSRKSLLPTPSSESSSYRTHKECKSSRTTSDCSGAKNQKAKPEKIKVVGQNHEVTSESGIAPSVGIYKRTENIHLQTRSPLEAMESTNFEVKTFMNRIDLSAIASYNNYQTMPLDHIQIVSDLIDTDVDNKRKADFISPLTCFSPQFEFSLQHCKEKVAPVRYEKVEQDQDKSTHRFQTSSQKGNTIEDLSALLERKPDRSQMKSIGNKVIEQENLYDIVEPVEQTRSSSVNHIRHTLDSFENDNDDLIAALGTMTISVLNASNNKSAVPSSSSPSKLDGLSFDGLSCIATTSECDSNHNGCATSEHTATNNENCHEIQEALCHDVNDYRKVHESLVDSSLLFLSPSNVRNALLQHRNDLRSSHSYEEEASKSNVSPTNQVQESHDDSTIGGFESAVGELSTNGIVSIESLSKIHQSVISFSKFNDNSHHKTSNSEKFLVNGMENDVLDERIVTGSCQSEYIECRQGIVSSIVIRSNVSESEERNSSDNILRRTPYVAEEECPNLYNAMEIFQSPCDFNWRSDLDDDQEDQDTASGKSILTSSNVDKGVQLAPRQNENVKNEISSSIPNVVKEHSYYTTHGTCKQPIAAEDTCTSTSLARVCPLMPEVHNDSIGTSTSSKTGPDSFEHQDDTIDWRDEFSPDCRPRRKRTRVLGRSSVLPPLEINNLVNRSIERLDTIEKDDVNLVDSQLQEDRSHSTSTPPNCTNVCKALDVEEDAPAHSDSNVDTSVHDIDSPSNAVVYQPPPKLLGKTILDSVTEEEDIGTSSHCTRSLLLSRKVVDYDVYEKLLIDKTRLESRVYEVHSDFETRSKPLEAVFEELRKLRQQNRELRSETSKSREIIPKALETIQDLSQKLEEFRKRIHELEEQNHHLLKIQMEELGTKNSC